LYGEYEENVATEDSSTHLCKSIGCIVRG
jgi:hypothetical protein